jgi:hypothetical protein
MYVRPHVSVWRPWRIGARIGGEVLLDWAMDGDGEFLKVVPTTEPAARNVTFRFFGRN